MRQTPSPAVEASNLSPHALRIAQEAGRAVMAIYNATPGASSQVRQKADGSPLTQADLAAHQVISQGLSSLTPDIPVVSEEDSASWVYRQPEDCFWLVDPLDGTKEFLARNGEFTVNIALVQNSVAVLGVVVAPALGLAYWGARGLGAFRQDPHGIEPIRVTPSTKRAGQQLRVLTSKSHMNAETQTFLDQLGPHELIQVGSSLKFCRIAEGSADLYPRLGPTCEWDTAAGQAVLEAAGGMVLRLDQHRPLRYGKAELVNPPFSAAAAD